MFRPRPSIHSFSSLSYPYDSPLPHAQGQYDKEQNPPQEFFDSFDVEFVAYNSRLVVASSVISLVVVAVAVHLLVRFNDMAVADLSIRSLILF